MTALRLSLLLLLLVSALCGVSHALRVSSASLSNATVGAATELLVAVDTDGTAVPPDAVFLFALAHGFFQYNVSSINTTLLTAQLDGSLDVAVANDSLVVARGGAATAVTPTGDLLFQLTQLLAPPVSGAVSLGILTVGNSTHPVLETLELSSLWIAPGQIWNADVEFANLISGRETALTIKFTTANAVPASGAVVVFLPRLYAALLTLNNVTRESVDGSGGQMEMQVVGAGLRFSWLENATDPGGINASAPVTLRLNGLRHPLLEGPIGRVVRIQTTDSSNTSIDQTLVDTSNKQLLRASVVLSKSRLYLKEADGEDRYEISLSAPPEYSSGVSIAIAANLSPPLVLASALVIEPATVVFTPSNWNIPTNVTVLAIEDDISLPVSSQYVISHTLVEPSAETAYAPIDDVIVTIQDDDLPLVHLSSRYVAVAETLRNDSYEIVLLSRPTTDVTVAIESSSALVDISPSLVTFSSSLWNISQSIHVVAQSSAQLVSTAVRAVLSHRVSSSDSIFTSIVPQSMVQVYYEPLEMVACTEPCRAGWFSVVNISTGVAQCIGCPLGHFCPGECATPTPCVAGTFSSSTFANSSSACIECSTGSYANAPGMSSCFPCPSGAACPYKDETFQPCPMGTFALENQGLCRPCPAGTFNNETFRDQCDPCPAGAFCAGGTALPVLCPNATYSVESGSRPCALCPAGYACSNSTLSPTKCPDGSYALAGGAQCQVCPQGYYCPHPALAPIKCGQGTYSHAAALECVQCPLGYRCIVPGLPVACGPGQISSGDHAVCSSCPAGFACPIAAATPVQCTAGSFSTGGAMVCSPCAAGFACPDTTSSQRIACSVGTYSTGVAASCTPCPAGYSCPSTSSATFTPCPTGWYSPEGRASCTECPRGYYCDVPHELPKNCTVGSYSVKASTSCVPCDPGYECPRSDQLPQPCPVGYYSGGAVANCKACRPGYKCGLASTNPTPPGDACPMGGYCNPPSTFFLCPAGTYGNVTAGESAEQACAPCPDGFYCEMGSTPLTRQICPPGYVCPGGTKRASQYPCPVGTFNPSPNQFGFDACQLCPSGSFCVQGSANPVVCPQGHYCLEGTISANRFPCPAGSYSGPQTGLTVATQCKPCEVGSYCPEGSSAPTSCPAGSYNPSTGAAKVFECLDCPPGWACPRVQQYEFVDRCAKGHFCPSGTAVATANPCPAGTYTERIDLIRTEDCTICPLRHACPQGTGGETQTMLDCGAGFFCPNGTAYAKQFPCPPGSWSSSTALADAAECDVCPVGKYCSGGKSFIDGPCSAGHYCPLGTPSPLKFPCPSGTFTAKTWLFEPSQCDDCPPGYYCPAGSVAPQPCKPGSYTSLNNTHSVGPGAAWPECTVCPAGYFCIDASVVPAPCGKGRFSAKGAKSCSTCEAGYFCNSDTTTDIHMRVDVVSWLAPGSLYGKCYNGTYCPPGSDHEPALEIDACPRGYFCPEATPAPVICPAGTYSNLTGQDEMRDCIPTPAGFFSLEGALQPTGICAPGFYCPMRSTSRTQIPCPERYYLNRTGGQSEEDCAVCVAGAYCPRGSAYPAPCPTGSYCRTGVSTPEPCPIGTYSNATGIRQVDDCLVCPPGMYCDSTGLTVPRGPCDPGYYCTLGSYTSAPMNFEVTLFGVTNRNVGGQCPRGSYCPLGSALPTACPPGTYNNFTGLEIESQCILCPPGQYCETPGLFLPTDDCFSGYYCTGGAHTPTQMATPPGYFSGNGSTAPVPCPAGQFNTYGMQAQCVECPAGFFCGSSGTIRPTICPKGSYCPKLTALPVMCPPGTLGDLEGLVAVLQCQSCPAGHFCDSFGLMEPSGPCFEGFVCSGGSPVANPVGAAFGVVCPTGFYCPSGSGAATECPRGSYRPAPGGTSLESCTLCPGGSFCGGTALTTPSGLCDEGYYCTLNVSTATPSGEAADGSGGPCPLGSYCPPGSSVPKLCPEGTYADALRTVVCTLCPSGYFCPLGSVGYATNPCPQGYYCPLGTHRGVDYPCLPGSFGNRTGLQEATQCTPAPGGMYIEGYAAVKPSGFCKSGFYCSSGSATSTPPTTTPSGGPCLPGTNCPEGSAVPIVCDAGFYCSSTNTDKALPCDPGFYCVQGSYTANPTGQNNSLGSIGDVCTPGHYCPRGTSNPIPCPPGTFSYNPQNYLLSQCSPCPPGFICSVSGIQAPYELCPAGFICTGGEREATQRCPKGSECPIGSSAPKTCPAGTFSDEDGLALCKLCPERYVCVAGTISPEPCPAGYFCPLQTPSSTKYQCPPGSFSSAPLLASGFECTICSPGRFCSGAAPTDRPTSECGPGHYCTSGASGATPTDGVTGDLCDGGYFCTGGAFAPNPTDGVTGSACQPGFYCPRGSSSPTRCAKGTYNGLEAQAACVACPAGGYCDTNATAPVPCPLRYYCPERIIDPVLCPSGTYGHTTALESADQCAPCAAGKYCVGGTLTASCAGGYYCKLFNLAPNPATNTTAGFDFGGACPIGYYCPEGVLDPIPCPASTARLETHGTSVDDCGPCPAGMSCQNGAFTVPCSAGHYCPYAQSAVACPNGSFNPLEGQTRLEDCLPCDAGKLCNRTGIIELTEYFDCPPGFYCLEASVAPTLCPKGRFRRGRAGKSVDDCALCTGGSYCEEGTVEPIVCGSRVYCPTGSSEPLVCPGGSYCPYNTTTPVVCPSGFYCPMQVALPISCERGFYCPLGSVAPLACPLGYIGRETPLSGLLTRLGDACEPCPAGTYGIDPNRTRCDVCLEGYVCLEGTKTNHPKSRDQDNGYPCPLGFFCPAGSSKEVACPSGSYQPNLQATNSTDCRLCPANSYQTTPGQASCLPCSKSAFAGVGAISCTCKGSHRAFQMTDGYCICEPGYEFYDQDMVLRSDEDDDVDCQPIVYDRCGTSQVRSDSGGCVAASQVSCEKSCGNSTGTLVSSLGICQCDQQTDIDTVCDPKCRAAAVQLRVDPATGALQLYDPVSKTTEPLSDESSVGVVAKVSCSQDSTDCQLHTVVLSAGGFAGSFDVPSTIEASASSTPQRERRQRQRRRLATAGLASTSVANPMVCLQVGQGIFFDLSTPGSYPVYLKDSMLNTNPTFDYGMFRALAAKIKSNASTVSAFAFTFTEAGIYVFGNSLNGAAKTVITVMQAGTTCPTEAAIVPLSEKNLISVSVKRRTDDMILAPDWELIIGLLGGLVGMVVAVIAGLYYFRTKSWATSSARQRLMGYRATSKQTDLATMHSKGAAVAKSTAASANQVGDTQTGALTPAPVVVLDELGKAPARASPQWRKGLLDSGVGAGDDFQSNLGRWDEENDLDLRELVDRLQQHHDAVAKSFDDQKGDVRLLLEHLQGEAAELKRLLVNTLTSAAAAGPPTHPSADSERGPPLMDVRPTAPAGGVFTSSILATEPTSAASLRLPNCSVPEQVATPSAHVPAPAVNALKDTPNTKPASTTHSALSSPGASTPQVLAVPHDELDALTLVPQQDSARHEYAQTLRDQFPQLSADEMQRLLDEYSTDMAKLSSSLKIEAYKNHEDVQTMQTARGLAAEGVARAMQAASAQEQDAMHQEQQHALSSLESKFAEEQDEIEREYQRELSRLELEFAELGDSGDGDEALPSDETMMEEEDGANFERMDEVGDGDGDGDAAGGASIKPRASDSDPVAIAATQDRNQATAARRIRLLRQLGRHKRRQRSNANIPTGQLDDSAAKIVSDGDGVTGSVEDLLVVRALEEEIANVQNLFQASRDDHAQLMRLQAEKQKQSLQERLAKQTPTTRDPSRDDQALAAAAAAVDRELHERLSHLDQNLAVHEAAVVESMEAAAVAASEDLDRVLADCRAEHEREVAALRERLALERQLEEKKLQDRLRRRREELHANETAVEVTGRPPEPDEERGALAKFEQSWADKEKDAPQEQTRYATQVEAVLREHDDAMEQQLSASKQETEAAEAELHRLRSDHARAMDTLQATLLTDRQWQAKALQDRLAARRLAGASSTAVEEEECVAVTKLEREMDSHEADAIAKARKAHQQREDQAFARVLAAVGQGSQVLATRAVVLAAGEAELDRIRRELEESEAAVQSQAALDAALRKLRLAERLAARRHQEAPGRHSHRDERARVEVTVEVVNKPIDDALQRIRAQQVADSQRLKEQLRQDAEFQKAQLRERIARKKRAAAAVGLSEQSAVAPLTDHELEAEEEAARRGIDETMESLQAATRSSAAAAEQATATSFEAAVVDQIDDMERLLDSCRAKFDSDAAELRQRLAQERQRQEQQLQTRQAKKRAQRLAAIDRTKRDGGIVLTAADEKALEAELAAAEQQERAAMETQLLLDERNGAQELQAVHTAQVARIVTSVRTEASKQRVEATEALELAEAELEQLREEHERERRALATAHDAERRRQQQNLRDKLTQKGAETLRTAGDERTKQQLAVALDAEDELRSVALDAALDGQFAAERQTQHQQHVTQDDSIAAAASEACGKLAASEAARRALAVARDAELRRVALELAEALGVSRSIESSEELARRARLEARLQAKRKRTNAALTQPDQTSVAAAIAAVDSTIDDELERIRNQHAADSSRLHDQLRQDAERRKAQLCDRIARKKQAAAALRRSSMAAVPSDQELEAEQAAGQHKIALLLEAAIDTAAALASAAENAFVDQVEETVVGHIDDMERQLAACRGQYDADAATLRERLHQERRLREQQLQDRLAKKRVQRLAAIDDSPATAAEEEGVEKELAAAEQQEHAAMESELTSSARAGVDMLRVRHTMAVDEVTTKIQNSASQERATALDDRERAEAALERLREEHDRELRQLAAAQETERRRHQLQLSDKLAKRRAEKLSGAASNDDQATSVLSALLDAEDQLSVAVLDAELDEQDAVALQSKRQQLAEEEQAFVVETLSHARANAAASEAARRAIDAARDAELSRVALELDHALGIRRSEDSSEAAARKARLAARLEAKKKAVDRGDALSIGDQAASVMDARAAASEVLESAADEELERIKRQYAESLQCQLSAIDAEAASRKAKLQERMALKRKALALRVAQGLSAEDTKAQEAAFQQEEANAEAAINADVASQKSAALQGATRLEQIAQDSIQAAVHATSDDIDIMLDACRQAHTTESEALKRSLEAERQWRELALRDRLARRREQKLAELTTQQQEDSSSSAYEEHAARRAALETQLDEQDARDTAALAASLAELEAQRLKDAEEAQVSQSAELVQQARTQARARQAAAKAARETAEDELWRVQDEHARELAALKVSLDAERRRQEQKLQDKLAAKRQQRLGGGGGDGKDDEAANVEEQLERMELQEALRQKETQALAEERRGQEEREQSLVQEVARMSAAAAAADAAREAIEAAGQAEMERIAADFERAQRRAMDDDAANSAANKSKLTDRLAQKKRRELNRSEPGASAVDSIASLPTDTVTVVSEAMDGAVDEEVERIQRQYAESLQRQVDQIESEAAAKKAALRIRMEQKRQALALRSGAVSQQDDQALTEEETTAEAAIDGAAVAKSHAASESSASEQQAAQDALRGAANASCEELERLLQACQRAHAQEADALRRALELERQQKEQALRDRLARRREQKLAEQPDATATPEAMERELAAEETRERELLARALSDEEARRLNEAEDAQQRQSAALMEQMEQQTRHKQALAQAAQALAEDELLRVQDEHSRERAALQASLDAERQRQEQKLQDKLTARRAQRQQQQRSSVAGGIEDTAAIDADEVLERLALEHELQQRAAVAMDEELRAQQECEQLLARQIAQAAAEASAAQATNSAIEAARQAEIERIAAEFAATRRRAMDEDTALARSRRAKLDERLAAKRQRAQADATSKPVAAAGAQTSLRSMAETHAGREIERLRREHAAACSERFASLEQDAALRKSQLAERIAKKRNARAVGGSEAPAPNDEQLERELEAESRAIDASVEVEKRRIMDEITNTQQQVSASVQAAAQRNAEQMEKLLLDCKHVHDAESKKLQLALDVERQRQEKALQDRIAKRKEHKKKTEQLPPQRAAQESNSNSSSSPPPVVDEIDEEAEKRELARQLEAKEAQVWEQMRRKQEDELLQLTRQAEAAALKKQHEAKLVQESAQVELDRLKREHEAEMASLTESLEAEQRRQQQQLQTRIAARRSKQPKQHKDSADAEERARETRLLEEQELADKLALEQEMQAEIATRLEQERARQRQQEAELVARVAQANVDAAAADATRRAMDAARQVELERLANEFDEKSRELQQTHMTDLMNQKQKLETRVAAKKQKKLAELEAKRALELQKLRAKQEQEERAARAEQQRAQAAVDEALQTATSGALAASGAAIAVSPVKMTPAIEKTKVQAEQSIAEPVNDELSRAAQQERDVVAIQQLFDCRVVPERLPLLAAVELVVSQRHQKETASLLARQIQRKTQAIRDALRDILQHKAVAKAAAMQGQASEHADQRMRKLDAAYDERIRAVEQAAIEAQEAQAAAEAQRQKERQLSELQFLLRYFNSAYAAAVQRQQQEEQAHESQAQQAARLRGLLGAEGGKDGSGGGRPPWRRLFTAHPSSDGEDQVNELRARLQLEADERIQQLIGEKSAELQHLQGELESELRRIHDEYERMAQEERAAMEHAFQDRVRDLRPDSKQRQRLLNEKEAQLASLLLMLQGRRGQQEARVRRLLVRKLSTVDHEYERKIQIVQAKMLQRLAEEKQLLLDKQRALAKATASAFTGPGSSVDTASSLVAEPGVFSVGGGDNTENLKTTIELRLRNIEGLIRDHRDGGGGGAAAVDYKTTMKQALEDACEWRRAVESTWMRQEEGGALLKAMPREAMDPTLQSQLDFANALVGMMAIPIAGNGLEPVVERVVVAASMPSRGTSANENSNSAAVENDPLGELTRYDAGTKTLFVRAACFTQLSVGQTALLLLHALAAAQTRERDVADLKVVGRVYRLLVHCYQNLFLRSQLETASRTVHIPPPREMEASMPQSKSTPGVDAAQEVRRPAAPKKASGQWKSHVDAMESFLSGFDRASPADDHNHNRDDAVAGRRTPALASSSSMRRNPSALLSVSRSSSRFLLSGPGLDGAQTDLELLAVQERRQFLLEKLDTAEKLYSHVLRQHQEQKQSLEYVQEEMLEQEQDHQDVKYEDKATLAQRLDELHSEAKALEVALTATRKERDELFAQCQALRDELERLPRSRPATVAEPKTS